MKKILATVFFIVMYITSTSSFAQSFNHNLFWFRLILADKITDKLRWELYLQTRTQNATENQNNIFAANHMRSLWFWMNYKLTPQLKLGVSPLGLFQSSILINKPEDESQPAVNEYRISARLDQENKYTHFTYTNRIGLDSRWRDLQFDGIYRHNFRFRYMVRIDVPIQFKNEAKTSFTLSAYNETWLQAGAAVRDQPNVFDQNRIYLGVGTNITKNTKISVGYLNIMQQRLNGKDFDNGNTLWVILTFDNLFEWYRNRKSETKQTEPKGESPVKP